MNYDLDMPGQEEIRYGLDGQKMNDILYPLKRRSSTIYVFHK